VWPAIVDVIEQGCGLALGFQYRMVGDGKR